VVIATEAARAIGADPIIGRSIERLSGWADIVGVVDVRDESRPACFTTRRARMSRSLRPSRRLRTAVDAVTVDLCSMSTSCRRTISTSWASAG
jgi:hypothetical protein